MKSLWHRIQRNPVINAFVLAMVTQLLHDYLANQIDWTNIAGYLATVFIGIWARENVVPLKEHKALKETLDANFKASTDGRRIEGTRD